LIRRLTVVSRLLLKVGVWAVLGYLGTACSATSSEVAQRPTDLGQSFSSGTAYVVTDQQTWEVPGRPNENPDTSILLIVPYSPPPGSGTATVELQAATAGDQPTAVVIVRWGDDESLAVTSSPTWPDDAGCPEADDMDWEPVAIRGQPACEGVNPAGL
jgi:hypothetical protein